MTDSETPGAWPFTEHYDEARWLFQQKTVSTHPLAIHLGFQFVDAAAGYCRIDIPWQQPLSNFGLDIHGGIHATLIDSVTGQAIMTLLQPEYALSTVNLNTQFFRPFKAGTMIAEGRVTRWGRTICHAQARLRVGEETIAEGTATYAIFEHQRAQRAHWVATRQPAVP